MEDDQTRPIQPVHQPDVFENMNWPKAFVIVGVTLIVIVGLVTVVALIALPSEFWTMPTP